MTTRKVGVLVFSTWLALATGTAQSAPCPTTGTGSALEKAVRGLAPGQWCELSPLVENGATVGDLLETCGSSLAWPQTYAASMGYDQVNQRILWHGTPHGGAGLTIKYDVTANLWTTEARPSLCMDSPTCNVGPPDNQSQQRCADCSARHAYDGVTCDGSGNMFAQATDNRIYRFSGSSWSSFSAPPQGNSTGAMVYWPSLGSQGSLIALDYLQDEVWRYDLATGGTWSKIGNVTLGNTYHAQVEYHPAADQIWIQGGNSATQHYRLWLNGGTPTLTALVAAPSGRLGLTSSKCVADPASADTFICWDMSEDTVGSSSAGWYAYDLSANTWASFSSLGITSMPPLYHHVDDFGGSPVTMAVLPDFGVTIWLAAARDDRSGGGMFVYNHSVAGTVEIPPNPASLNAN